MNITIIGASAGIGLETVKRGLNRNHSITTLSRSEIEIEEKKLLNMILGDATNKADLLNSIQNADAIIITLGTGLPQIALHCAIRSEQFHLIEL